MVSTLLPISCASKTNMSSWCLCLKTSENVCERRGQLSSIKPFMTEFNRAIPRYCCGWHLNDHHVQFMLSWSASHLPYKSIRLSFLRSPPPTFRKVKAEACLQPECWFLNWKRTHFPMGKEPDSVTSSHFAPEAGHLERTSLLQLGQ